MKTEKSPAFSNGHENRQNPHNKIPSVSAETAQKQVSILINICNTSICLVCYMVIQTRFSFFLSLFGALNLSDVECDSYNFFNGVLTVCTELTFVVVLNYANCVSVRIFLVYQFNLQTFCNAYIVVGRFFLLEMELSTTRNKLNAVDQEFSNF